MTAPTEIRQRAIALLQQLPGESLLKALEFLESLAYESLPLSETPETANSEAALLQIIQSRLSLEEQNRFSYLRQQKENGEITEAENQELLTYINRVKQQDTDA
ncbi:WD-repeat protein [Nodularia spumigena CCY9414]|nr:WD-repeat protein [Nodularia spumigena CCY9414]